MTDPTPATPDEERGTDPGFCPECDKHWSNHPDQHLPTPATPDEAVAALRGDLYLRLLDYYGSPGHAMDIADQVTAALGPGWSLSRQQGDTVAARVEEHEHQWYRVGGPPDEPWDDNVYDKCACGETRPYPGAPTCTDPEMTCQCCGGRNVRSWSAPSPVWNRAMRDPHTLADLYGIVCPSCFTELAAAAGVDTHWRLFPIGVDVHSLWKDRDGRVWDAERWLWVEPTGIVADGAGDGR